MDSSFHRVLRFLCLCLIALSPDLWAASIGLVATDSSPRTQKFHSHLAKLLPAHSVNLVLVDQLSTQKHDRWVTLNAKALASLAQQHPTHQRVLALFLSVEKAKILQKQFPDFTFSWLDNGPSVQRQLALIKALKPQAGHIGVFYSSDRSDEVEIAKAAAAKLGMEILAAPLDDPLNWDRAALRVLKQSDVVLGLNDRKIYNATNIRSILMRLYRANRPLVGPDKPYVKAGAVASTYSGVSDTLRAAAELLNSDAQWTPVVVNQYFRVSVNRQVARSLQISLDDEANLKKKVEGGAR